MGITAQPGRVTRQDYVYIRHGTANLFVAIEPKGKRRKVTATKRKEEPR